MQTALQESYFTQRDQDEFDACCHHLIIVDKKNQQVIGTYRRQTHEMAAAANRFYSTSEFDLTPLPDEVMQNSVEVGCVCIAAAHRNGHVLFLRWRGLAVYMMRINQDTAAVPALSRIRRQGLRPAGHRPPR